MSFAVLLISMTFAAAAPAGQVQAMQDVEKRLGPFTVAGQTVTVVTLGKRLPAASDGGLTETVASLELRDSSNALNYQKTFAYRVENGKFRESVSVSARLVSGSGLAGLLIRYRRQPAPAGAGESWQIFRLRDGKLAPLDPPADANPLARNGGFFGGAILNGGQGAIASAAPQDTLEIRAWTGNFYVTVPVRVNWQQGRLMPGQQCFEMRGGPGGLAEVACEMRVDASRQPSSADFTFVRLFSEASEDMGIPKHVVLKKDSRIQYLSAKAIVKWDRNGDEMIARFSDVWLKVLIDDNDDNLGWIHTEEDFSAVGLPAATPPE